MGVTAAWREMNKRRAHQPVLEASPLVGSLQKPFEVAVYPVADRASRPVPLFRRSIHFLDFENSSRRYRQCFLRYRRSPVRIDRPGASLAPVRWRIVRKNRLLIYSPRLWFGWETIRWQSES